MKQYSVEVAPPANRHETGERRNAKVAKQPLLRPIGMKCSTVYEFAIECFSRNKNMKAMGYRDIIDIHEEIKLVEKRVDGKMTKVEKKWLYFELSPYKYETFHQLIDNLHNIGRGLVKIGLNPHTDDRLHIFASTSHKWMKMYLGSQSQSIPIVTAYDTLGENGLIHSMWQTGSTAIFTDNNLLSKLIGPLSNVEKTNKIRYIIYNEILNPQDKRFGGKLFSEANNALTKLKEIRPDIEFYSFDDILSMGSQTKDEIDPHPPRPEDLSCIMYTSGSTGDPKGVVLKHSNIVAGVAGVSHNARDDFVNKGHRIISFLPLAHIFELVFELVGFYWGGIIGYANVKTLSAQSMRNCKGDIQEFKPTLMVGVAAVWETIRKGILQQINALPTITQKIFWSAYYTKLKLNKWGLPGGNMIGNLVFKKIKEATGGKLRYMCNGGSPISKDAQEFLSNILCPMLIGYGLTETVACAAVLEPEHFEIGIAGDLTGAITAKLVDVEELGYLAKNNQGELWLKGAPVLSEYYKNPEETAKVLTKDGWFKTGDIAEWTPHGQVKIIDRKKNLVKTLNGEYVALEKLESVYRSNQYVTNICVYADQSKVKPVGIIVPVVPVVSKLAVQLGVMKPGDNLENHVHDTRLRNAILADMLKTGKSQGLTGIEFLAGIAIFSEEWTPENGFVTSAQKLKRKEILNAVKTDVDSIYGDSK
ncbi:long-chain-fatty-acid--CoA ligase 1 [Monosporozyma unispora]